MPIELITTNLTGSYFVDSNDDVYLMPGVTMTSTTEAFYTEDATFSGATVNVLGSIVGSLGIHFTGGVTENNDIGVYIDAQGSVNATSFGILLQQGANNVVVNYGEIVAQRAGVYSEGGEIRVANHGSITSFGTNFFSPIYLLDSTRGSNIREVLNTGVIEVASNNYTRAIFNSGGAEFHLDNSGSIFGGGAGAVVSSAAANFITNTGLIVGDISVDAVTQMTNAGIIDGDVSLSTSADDYQGINDGTISGLLSLGIGDDHAIMGNGGSRVQGGIGDDTIRGGTGVDQIDGGADNDDIRGRMGDDILNGGSGDDVIRAGQGDDVLIGGSGNDFMRGGAGEDVIIGGLGQDTMFGNGGSDVFVFNTASESTNAGGAWDRIMDFEQGQDLIDLSNFNARFIGTSAYAANGNIAEVRIFEDPNGDTRVFVDVNADGVSDMRFYLVNVTGVTADDFIL